MKYFKREFFNQFEFKRYSEQNNLRNNTKFLELFDWLVGPINDGLFSKIQKFLILEGIFIKSRGKIFKDEVCNLVALEKLRKISMKKEILELYKANMFKYAKKFQTLKKAMKQMLTPVIEQKFSLTNITKSEKKSVCNDVSNKVVKSKNEALVLSYLYLFLTIEKSHIGAGDLASSEFKTGLDVETSDKTATKFSRIFNEMVNGSIPGSIFESPMFFVYPNEQRINIKSINAIETNIDQLVKLLKLECKTIRDYYYLWYTFNMGENKNFTIYCYLHNSNDNCTDTDGKQFKFPTNTAEQQIAELIRKEPKEGVIIEGQMKQEINPFCFPKTLI